MVTPQTSAKQRLKALKPSYVLSILLGVTLMLTFSKLGASNAQSPSHVYELRLYHAKEGKMDALKARFGDHTDSIFKRHNMKEHWLLVARGCAGFSEPVHLHSGASQPAGSGEKLGCFPSRSGMAEGEGRIGS